ncbi:MAG: tRNA (guanine(46)-N(7))-methyltransferase TrmB [Myxococcales bacterium]
MRRPKLPIPPNPVLPDRPDWAGLFGRTAPLHVEIGSGHGGFALAFAAAQPGVDLVAFEWRRKFADWTRAKAAARGLGNLRVLGADPPVELPRLFQEASLAAIHLHFPDPWWKRRHQKRRVVDGAFAALLFARLVQGGLLDVRTDVLERALDMCEVLEAAGFANEAGAGRFSERPEGEIPSTREKRYLASGDPVFRLRLRRPSV